MRLPPPFEVAVAAAGERAGEDVARHTPSLAAAYPSLVYSSTSVSELDGLDLVFLALPHGRSQQMVPDLLSRVGVVVDLAADFRLHDPTLYPVWYGEEHAAPELLGQFVYGLPELNRHELRDATSIAAPGCYPTAAILALAPLLRAGLMAVPGADQASDAGTGGPPLIVDAASGVSGAGRAPKPELQFGSVDEDFVAYGLLDHRHTAEMEQSLGSPVLFTPHLAPMVRGILATCYGRPVDGPAVPDRPPPTPCTSSSRPTATSRSWWSPKARRRPRPPADPIAPTSPCGWTRARDGWWRCVPSTT